MEAYRRYIFPSPNTAGDRRKKVQYETILYHCENKGWIGIRIWHHKGEFMSPIHVPNGKSLWCLLRIFGGKHVLMWTYCSPCNQYNETLEYIVLDKYINRCTLPSTLPIVIIFFGGCVPEMFAASYSVAYCIYIPGNRDFVFIVIVQFMMSANSRIRFGLLIVFVCLYITPSHYHHCTNVTEDIELIKWLTAILSSVWVRLKVLSQLSIIHYMCVFSSPISLVIERIYTLSYYRHQIGSMNYYLLFRVRSWNNCMRRMSQYILISIFFHFH